MHLLKRIILIMTVWLLMVASDGRVLAEELPHGNYVTVSVNGDEDTLTKAAGTELEVVNSDSGKVCGSFVLGKDGKGYCNGQTFMDRLKPGNYTCTVKKPAQYIEFNNRTASFTLEDKTVLPSTVDVTFVGHVFGVDSDGNFVGSNDGETSTVIWESSFGTGQFYCGNTDANSPPAVGGLSNIGTTRPVSTEEMKAYEGADADDVRKVLYYGWGGPAQWEGFTSGRYKLPYSSFEPIDIEGDQIKNLNIHENRGLGQFITHVALNHYHNEGRDWWGNVSPTACERQDGYSDFIDYLDSMPLPDEDFQVYVWENYDHPWQQGVKRSVQDMFFSRFFTFGEYDSKAMSFTAERLTGKIQLKKEGNDPVISVSGAVYQLFTDEKATVKALDVHGQEAILTIGENGLSNEVELYLGETYYLKEQKAPQGYALDQKIHEVVPDKTHTVITVSDDIQQVRIGIVKVDEETKENKPQMYGEFKNARYEILSKNEAGEYVSVETVTLDENGKGTSGKLYPGTYYLREIEAPKGYLLNPEIYEVKAEADNENTVEFRYEVEVSDKPTNLQIYKCSLDEKGEQIIVSGAHLHLEDEEGKVIEPEWISSEEPHVIKGLAIGKKYYLVESEAGECYLLNDRKMEIVMSQEDNIRKVYFFNEMIPLIKTRASFNDNDLPMHLINEETSVRDVVTIEKLTVNNEYMLKSSLVNLNNGEVYQSVETVFKTTDSTMNLNVDFKKNRYSEAMVVNAELYRIYEDGNTELIATHDGTANKDQQLFIPKIGTEVHDTSDNDRILFNDGTQTVQDVIKYENLIPGNQYEIITELADSDTGEMIEGSLVKTSFVPEEADGVTNVVMDIDASLLKGRRLTAFEEVRFNEITVACHKDITDEKQTLIIPDLITDASHHSEGESTVVLTDTIMLVNFEKGREVEITASLMDYDNHCLLVDGEGEALRKTVRYTPLNDSDSLDVSFEVASDLINDRKVVFFEEGQLTEDPQFKVIHQDWENERQSVLYSKSVNTGDANNIAGYIGLLGCSLFMSGLTGFKLDQDKRKRR